MIYHFRQYLKDQFPALQIVPEFRDPSDRQDCVIVREGSGASEGYPLDRIDATVQVIVRAKSSYTARDTARQIFVFCRESHNFDLPAGITGDADLRIKHMKCLQPPYSTGQEPSGPFMYVFNVLFTYQDS